MGRRTAYAPGTFSWVDLGTTDAGAAKRFYAGLFGWELEDTDAGGGAVYTMCRLGGDAVSGLFELSQATRAGDATPTWMSYVTVEEADATAARAQELGGTIVRGAFDVLDAGRMAVLEDPQGAVLALWQPRARIGAERVNDPGCLCMNELVTPDVGGARAFYGHLFGWRVEEAEADAGGPHMIFNGGEVNASLFAAPDDTPAHWRACFTVASVEDAVRRARELGAEPMGEPADLGHGSLAMVRDPQGGRFTVFAGETDP